jgi:hypothetical protein
VPQLGSASQMDNRKCPKTKIIGFEHAGLRKPGIFVVS